MFHQVLDFFLAFSELSSPLEQFTYKDIGREFLFSLRHIGADFVKSTCRGNIFSSCAAYEKKCIC